MGMHMYVCVHTCTQGTCAWGGMCACTRMHTCACNGAPVLHL